MAGSIRDALPPSYHHMVNDFFDRPKFVETRATCDRCAMCDHGEPSPVKMDYFHPETKCCTYWPALPNYLVGAILADPSPAMAEGQKRMRSIIAKRVSVTPGYVNRPRKWSLLMLGYSEAFGRTKTLKCPYYDDDNPAGACSIWRHREAVCMTYFCKSSAGVRGHDFWNALKDYLGYVQNTLARRAMIEVDPKLVEPTFKKTALSVEDFEERAPRESDYAAWWGSWVGREEEFYRRCHEWTQSVSPALFAQNIDLSDDGKRLLTAVITKCEALESKIVPKNLIRNTRMKVDHAGDKVVVTPYQRYDSLAVDKDLFDVVDTFRADQTLAENLERLKVEEGIELVPELVEYLFQAGVLVEPTKAKVAGSKDGRADNPGELNGRRAALRAILEARGFVVTDETKATIGGAEQAKLDAWIKKAVLATSVEAVLKD